MYRILIIDDDRKRSNRIVNELSLLNLFSGNIEQAYSVIEAKRLLEEKFFDAVIIDIVLPNRSEDKIKVNDGGVRLLQDIKRRKRRKLPSRVIGITSNLDQHLYYQDEFNKLCEVVIPVEPNSRIWLDKIVADIRYRLAEKLSAKSIESESALVTVHGIRTFGEWQNRLYGLVKKESKSVSKLNYDYGYLDLVSFMLPFLRNRPANRLYDQLVYWSEVHSAKKFYFVAHSFGTYILARSLKRLILENKPVQIEGVILCGSVLKSNENWDEIRNGRSFFVVNECGTHDFVLWASNLFAPKLGMAGKTGFSWLNTDYQLNRYHAGGHSLYFEKDGKPIDDFMVANWLPLILGEDTPVNIDERNNSFFHYGILEVAVKALGIITYPLVVVSIFLFIYFLIKMT